MSKKLTISMDETVYNGLREMVGGRGIGRFIENLVRSHVLRLDLKAQYQEMGRQEKEEREALEWSEGLAGDAVDEAG